MDSELHILSNMITEKERRQVIVDSVNSSTNWFEWNQNSNQPLDHLINQAAESIGGAQIVLSSNKNNDLLNKLNNQYKFIPDTYLPEQLLIVAKDSFLTYTNNTECAVIRLIT